MLSLATELSSRLLKEGFIGKHLSLKVMRRAADAPLDPPKHLGHGMCDTFNKSVQLGVATNDAERLGKEGIFMLRGMRIPPGELRGIGLQMGKLERPGKSDGQKKLVFSKAPRTEMATKASSEPLDDPAKSPNETTDELPHPPAPKSPHTPVKATQFIAPTQIDPEVLANLPEDIRSRIISRKPPTNPIQSSQIDESVLRELPPSIQAELLEEYRQNPKPKVTPKRKKPSPRKIKPVAGQSKFPVTPDALDPEFLAELPSTIREEVISEANRERARARSAKELHLAWAAERAVRDRKVNRTVSIPEPPPKPTFQKVSELPDLRNLISAWFADFKDEEPAEEDVELLGGYLRKVVLVEKDLQKAEAVVRWFMFCCQDVEGPIDEWWAAGQRLGVHVNEACSQRGIANVNFDTLNQQE
jgi:DNA repair protein REV1